MAAVVLFQASALTDTNIIVVRSVASMVPSPPRQVGQYQALSPGHQVVSRDLPGELSALFMLGDLVLRRREQGHQVARLQGICRWNLSSRCLSIHKPLPNAHNPALPPSAHLEIPSDSKVPGQK